MPAPVHISGYVRAKETLVHSLPRQVWGMQADSSPAALFFPSTTRAASQPPSCLLGSRWELGTSPLDLHSCRGHIWRSPLGDLLNPFSVGSNHTSNVCQRKNFHQSPLSEAIYMLEKMSWMSKLIPGHFLWKIYFGLAFDFWSLYILNPGTSNET